MKAPFSTRRHACLAYWLVSATALLAACSNGGGAAAVVVPPPAPRHIETVIFVTEDGRQLRAAADDGSTGRLLSGTTTQPIKQFALAPAGDRVAYVGDGAVAGQHELFVAAIAAGAPLRVSTSLGPDEDVLDFAWSPDGTRLAYRVRGANGQVALQSVARDGGGGYRVYRSSNPAQSVVGEYSWSPDGAHLGFLIAEGDDEPTRLGVHDTAGAVPDMAPGPFVSSPRQIESIAFSSDSEWVALRTDPMATGQYEIYRYSPTSGGAALRSNGAIGVAAQVGRYVWSSSGRYLAQAVLGYPDASVQVGVNVFDVQNRTSVRIVTTGDYGEFAWAPDGNRLALAADFEPGVGPVGGRRLLIYDADTNAMRVASGPLAAGESVDRLAPRWSPDGAHLAYATTAAGAARLWLTTPGGGKPPVPAADLAGDEVFALHWSPDGARLGVLELDQTAPGHPGEWHVVDAAGRSVWRSGAVATLGCSRALRWASDSRAVVYSVAGPGTGDDLLRSVAPGEGEGQAVTALAGKAALGFAYAPAALVP